MRVPREEYTVLRGGEVFLCNSVINQIIQRVLDEHYKFFDETAIGFKQIRFS